jgi:hypothetical protein
MKALRKFLKSIDDAVSGLAEGLGWTGQQLAEFFGMFFH